MSRTDKDAPWRILRAQGIRISPWAPPTRQERHVEWWGPDRARVRDSLKSAAKEFRAAGEVEAVTPTINHRHASIKGWWN
jgi:hypothetical protein